MKNLLPRIDEEELNTYLASSAPQLGIRDEEADKPYSTFNFSKYLRAYQLYMEHEHTNVKISKVCRIPKRQLDRWIQKYKWRKMRDDLEEEIIRNQEEITKHLLLKKKPDIIKRHIAMAEDIDGRIAHIVHSENLGTKQLSEITSAFKNNAEISHKIVGIGEKEDKDVSVNVLIQPGLRGQLVNGDSNQKTIEAEVSEPAYYTADIVPTDSPTSEPPDIDEF